MKFTRGPWYVYNNDVYLEVVSDKGAICDTCMSGHEFDGGDCTEGKSAKANAHLIAAAPEMYEAIKHVLEMQLRGFIVLGNEATDKLQKSLAKARGE